MSYKKVKDVICELEAHKFWFVRQKGSHMVYTNGTRVVVIPNHTNKGIEKVRITISCVKQGLTSKKVL